MVRHRDFMPWMGPFEKSARLNNAIQLAKQARLIELSTAELNAVAQIAYLPEKVGETFRYNHHVIHQQLMILLSGAYSSLFCPAKAIGMKLLQITLHTWRFHFVGVRAVYEARFHLNLC
jgi:hypothetical protein